ncbi:hypothetical protein EYF80_009140 [Liparis tanakae]|uniref:Uncharacterized protein n=1 Tax=Liparis tanakae TaxID=230148 RepID=A0A4Z2ITJ9_9TELE|nr:hypothetical protein EYF80_009140 [Liparis tanakae]
MALMPRHGHSEEEQLLAQRLYLKHGLKHRVCKDKARTVMAASLCNKESALRRLGFLSQREISLNLKIAVKCWRNEHVNPIMAPEEKVLASMIHPLPLPVSTHAEGEDGPSDVTTTSHRSR